MKRITIAIDGFSSCGKSTMAKSLARKIGYTYIDSGAMYRAVTLYCLDKGIIAPDGNIDETRLRDCLGKLYISFIPNRLTGSPDTYLDGINVEEDIRQMRVSSQVSRISAIPFVREALVRQQQSMGKNKGVVMDGRDIGTTVFPDAELKIFVTADAQTRAMRRYNELKAKGDKANFDDILHNVIERDRIDQTREVSPLRKADDAITLDNSNMSVKQQDEWLIEQYRKAAAEDNDRKD